MCAFLHMTNWHGVVELYTTGFDWGRGVKLTWCSRALYHYVQLREGVTSHLKLWAHYPNVHLIWGYTSSEKMTSFCSWPPDVTTGGTSHLRVHFIWKYELILGLGLASQRSFLRKTNNITIAYLLSSGTDNFIFQLTGYSPKVLHFPRRF